VVTVTLDDVTRSKRPEPTADEAAAAELVRLAREQGQPPHPPGRAYVVRLSVSWQQESGHRLHFQHVCEHCPGRYCIFARRGSTVLR
jgi:hypothetical protein